MTHRSVCGGSIERNFVVAAVGALLPFVASPAVAQSCAKPTPSIASPTAPIDVDPQVNACSNKINFFDDYSWRSFIALIWPTAQGQRGVPDPAKRDFPVGGPLVFETYKADWESFPPPSAPNPPPPPLQWPDFAGAANPCGASVDVKWGDLVLASYSKFGNLGLADFGAAFVGPVISSGFSHSKAEQDYLRFQASYNRTEFEQILDNQWYLRDKIGNLTFCSNGATVGGKPCPAENSIDLKSSWMDMRSVPSNLHSRYFTRQAWVLSPDGKSCSKHEMGLLGLHIVTKTPTRPQWIWSTFEQIDNAPWVTGATKTNNTVFNLNDGIAANVMPSSDPYCVKGDPNNACPGTPPPPEQMPADASLTTRYNITRTQHIGTGDDTTPWTNAQYQALLASAAPNSPWQFYQLVMTQWPIGNSAPQNPGTPNFTVPGNLTPVSSFSNVTMETFDQTSFGPPFQASNGCMNCHNLTAHPGHAGDGTSPGNDFLWSLAVNAYPLPPSSSAAAALAGASTAPRRALDASSQAAFEGLNALLRAGKSK